MQVLSVLEPALVNNMDYETPEGIPSHIFFSLFLKLFPHISLPNASP